MPQRKEAMKLIQWGTGMFQSATPEQDAISAMSYLPLAENAPGGQLVVVYPAWYEATIPVVDVVTSKRFLGFYPILLGFNNAEEVLAVAAQVSGEQACAIAYNMNNYATPAKVLRSYLNGSQETQYNISLETPAVWNRLTTAIFEQTATSPQNVRGMAAEHADARFRDSVYVGNPIALIQDGYSTVSAPKLEQFCKFTVPETPPPPEVPDDVSVELDEVIKVIEPDKVTVRTDKKDETNWWLWGGIVAASAALLWGVTRK